MDNIKNENTLDTQKQIEELEKQVKQLTDALNQQINENKLRESTLLRRQEEVLRKESELSTKEKDIKLRETLLSDKERAFEGKENTFNNNSLRVSRELAIKEERVLEREKRITEKEAMAEEDIAKRKILLSTELAEKKTNFEKTLAEEKEKHLSSISVELSNLRSEFESDLEKERKVRLQKLEEYISKEKEEKLAELEKEKKEKLDFINKELAILSKDREEILARKSELEREKEANELAKRRNERKIEQLEAREASIEDTVMARYDVKIKSYTNELKILEDECNRIREKLQKTTEENEHLRTIKIAYGEEPSILLKKIEDLQDSKEQLEKELASRPNKELHAEYEQIKRDYEQLNSDIKNLKDENKTLRKYQADNSGLEIENRRILSVNANLKTTVDELENECEVLRNRIKRLSTSEGRASDRDERIKEIRAGFIKDMFSPAVADVTDEILWLNSIEENCRNYGILFPKRILYAFHTALKIADWSSVTVLAGVSGTGKSELPRLYSAFGGLNFINVPVQPNWDSQESMLGFFNSIDNRFDAQPLLRFLVECTEDAKYSEYMSIVLLDEMNLAHVEHYFADFLSKLESRRGADKDVVPTIEVKLGAGVTPYQLSLARTILWTGTMNQDETTKSLSDKVLDRGIVINFPRPRTLSRRKQMLSITDVVKASNRPMLKKSVWNKWIVRDINFSEQQLYEINKYKKIVEEINDALEYAGRALGHRVWQSIEYYIANYPTVLSNMKVAGGDLTVELKNAMRTAFEDQIVQKIMPKLRGIETRGKGGENLRKIEDILEMNGFEKLKDDFEIACVQGYGQFMWSSAKYIEADEIENISENE